MINSLRVVAVGLVVIGFFAPYWPLALSGVILMALLGLPVGALALGALLDVAWGVPGGVLGWLLMPHMAAALLGVGMYAVAKRYVFSRDFSDVY